jgi:hypothetical protein
MARLHRLGRAYSHEGVIESSLGDIGIYYNPDEDGSLAGSATIPLTHVSLIPDDDETQVSAV